MMEEGIDRATIERALEIIKSRCIEGNYRDLAPEERIVNDTLSSIEMELEELIRPDDCFCCGYHKGFSATNSSGEPRIICELYYLTPLQRADECNAFHKSSAKH